MRNLTRIGLLIGAVAVAGLAMSPAGGQEAATEATKALEKAEETGKKLFADKKFGTSGKSCADCHAKPARPKMHLKNRVGDYPKYDRREKRVITLGTKINQMIQRMLKGKEETLGSDRLVAIEAYLMKQNRDK